MSETSDMPASLNITDIAAAVQLIDLAADQGIFRGWDVVRHAMSVRDRLDLFVTAASAQLNTPATTLE